RGRSAISDSPRATSKRSPRPARSAASGAHSGATSVASLSLRSASTTGPSRAPRSTDRTTEGAVSIVEGYEFEAMVGDVDDHRPNTRWALLVDPGGPEGRVASFGVIKERIAPGD